jgi:hypothetical protein
MKKIIFLAILSIAISACSKTVVVKSKGGLPPGQMKKVTGSQSAKPYAPGQQKKTTTTKTTTTTTTTQKKKKN